MRRKTMIITLIFIMLMSGTTFANNNIDVMITNQKVDFNILHNGQPIGYPYIENGRTYVPIRVISENLGYKVDWVQSRQTAVIIKNDVKVEIRIGDTKALVNGVIKNIDVDSNGNITNTKAVIKNSRTYVPVRFIAEAMGEKVDYRDPSSSSVYNKTVYINSSNLPEENDTNISTEDIVIKQRINEIENKWSQLKPTFTDVRYNITPKTSSPYVLGELTDETLNNALNTVNFIRYIAYLPSDVRLNKDYNSQAQATSLVNAVNNQLTHTPSKPASMPG